MLTELTIDRFTWACAPNNKKRGGHSLLRDLRGFKCCLGFYAEACGMPTQAPGGVGVLPTGYGTLSSVPEEQRTALLNPAVFERESDLISANDRSATSEEREARITQLFAECGVKVTFVGEYL